MRHSYPSTASTLLHATLAVLVAAGCAGHSMRLPHIPLAAARPAPAAGSGPAALFQEPFDRLDRSQWREVEVKGHTQYALETLDTGTSLKAHSLGGASILLRPFRFDPDTYARINWRWRVDRFVEGENLHRKEGSDASARVYVYFDTAGLPWQKRNIDYVWSRTLPIGTILNSPFSKASKIIVVDSGIEHQGTWHSVSRNLEKDYRRCFGKSGPPNVTAIGLMTDTDNTRSEALAYFDDVVISPEPTANVGDGAP